MSIKNPLIPAGIEPASFRFVAQHLNHCATAVSWYILREFEKTVLRKIQRGQLKTEPRRKASLSPSFRHITYIWHIIRIKLTSSESVCWKWLAATLWHIARLVKKKNIKYFLSSCIGMAGIARKIWWSLRDSYTGSLIVRSTVTMDHYITEFCFICRLWQTCEAKCNLFLSVMTMQYSLTQRTVIVNTHIRKKWHNNCRRKYIEGFTRVSVLSESNMSDRCRTSFSTCIRKCGKLCCKYNTRKFKAFNLAVLLVSIFVWISHWAKNGRSIKIWILGVLHNE